MRTSTEPGEAGGPSQNSDPSYPSLPSHWGSFTLGGAAYAVSLEHLREAVPASRLTVWPGTAACVAGAVELRGLMLPVVDLRRLAGSAASPDPITGMDVASAAPPPPPLVIVIAHDGHLLGLCADAVTGLFQAPADGLQPVTLADGSEPCVRGGLSRPDRDELVSVLNPPALMALPQVPRCRDPRAADWSAGPVSRQGGDVAGDVSDHVSDHVADSVHWLLVRAGDWCLAIDSACVRMAVPLDGLRPSVLSRLRGNTDCLGEWPHPSQPIAVIDPLIRTGLGALAEGEARQALLLDTDGGLLGLAIGAVLDVRHLGASALQPMPGGRVSQPGWFAGVLSLDGSETASIGSATGPVFALDARQWTAHPDLIGMASLHAAELRSGAGLAKDGPAGGVPATLTLLTYGLPAEAGTPIDQVDEVLPWQPDRPGLDDDGQSPWLGIVMHRDRPVTLLCLRRWSGAAAGPIDAAASILVVRHGEHRIGFVVPRLLAIESAGWQPSVCGVLRSRNPTPITAARLAQIDPPTGPRRLVPVLDLQDIAAKALALRPVGTVV